MPGALGAVEPAPATTPVADSTPPKPPTEEMVKAQEDAQEKAEAADIAKQEALSISERLKALDENITLEKKLLDTTRRKADNANETRSTLADELQEKSIAGAPPAELQDLVKRIREAEKRFREARAEVRDRTDRLNDLQAEHGSLLTQQNAALSKAEHAKEQLKIAEKTIEKLQNPFSPRNMLQWLLDHGPRLLAIVIGMIFLHWLSRVFTRRLIHLMSRSSMRGTKEEREDRARTLVGVFHNAASVAIFIGGFLMVFQEIGVPIAPLMGGAAVVGLAVAFGAQNLIRDYFYGFVILLENQYKLNDVVKIGELAGQVEQITLRMTVLRDLEGRALFIPNGEITSVTNMTHGWSRALFDVGVAYKEDVDEVMEILSDLGRQLRRDPTYSPLILEDLTMLGVDAFGDSAVVIKFFIKTRPLQQWTVKREFLRRVKNKFDELGIEIPFPHRTVYHHAVNSMEPQAIPAPHDRTIGTRVRSA